MSVTLVFLLLGDRLQPPRPGSTPAPPDHPLRQPRAPLVIASDLAPQVRRRTSPAAAIRRSQPSRLRWKLLLAELLKSHRCLKFLDVGVLSATATTPCLVLASLMCSHAVSPCSVHRLLYIAASPASASSLCRRAPPPPGSIKSLLLAKFCPSFLTRRRAPSYPVPAQLLSILSLCEEDEPSLIDLGLLKPCAAPVTRHGREPLRVKSLLSARCFLCFVQDYAPCFARFSRALTGSLPQDAGPMLLPLSSPAPDLAQGPCGEQPNHA
ncbi:hypothetical protein CFC21_016624 [Triticum aestivum]|uniref:Uncharacterized protein n=2 Tax=Triticum aestivum TaxID=4565 RepID=A0A9R1DYY0_WHEAT|nr:hypothetical protein CFC21_016624 [Triticum aestivum]